MSLIPVSICSRALLRLGCTPITSFDDRTAESDLASSLYAGIRDALLSSHPWSFATAQMRLAKLALQPLADYDHAFALPVDCLRVISAGTGGQGSGVEYRMGAGTLWTNSAELLLTYIFRAPETQYPPFFEAALVARLAAEFCLPLTESAGRAEMLFKLADDECRKAKAIDSQQDTPRKLASFPLIDARD